MQGNVLRRENKTSQNRNNRKRKVRVCVSTLLLELSCTFVVSSEMGTVQGSKAFFQQALIKARESKKCPLCARGYDTQEGLDNLISSVSIYLHAHVQYMYGTAYYMQQVLHV